MKKQMLVFIALLGLAIPVLAQTAPASSLVTAIEIRGNNITSEREISKYIFTRVGETVLDEKLRSDLKAIYALGYFADVSATFEAFSGGSRVIFLVTENPKLSAIEIEGNTVYSTAEIMALIKTRPDNILNFKTLQADIETINNYYKDNGYILARVINVETDEKAAVLHIKIIEGVVESVSLTGNELTRDYVILRELKTKAGTPLNEKTLKKDLRNVFNLGFFSEVSPKFEAGSTADKVVLQLNIKETRSSTINFGGGYGEREGWFGFMDLSINNLMGTAQGLLIRGQSGQQLSTYQFRYFNPWFLPERLGERTSLTFRRWLTVGRDIYLTDQSAVYNGFDVSMGRPFLEDYTIAWTLGSELAEGYNSSTFEAYQSDSIGLTLSYDTRDFWLNPTEGRYYSLSVKQGWKKALTTAGFFKLGWDLNHYYTMIPNHILALHGGAGVGFGDVPSGELYWAGGANSIRGFYPSQAKTGKRKLLFNIEYRLNFSDLFQGVFFYDWGKAWNEGAPQFGDFIWGWGPGLRINTPLGPIRLDYGVPGGKTFSEGIMHFSIGQAF